MAEQPSIVCPMCGRRSYHPKDIEYRYCPVCGYHDNMPVVLNKHRDHIPPDAVYCGRGSPYGNPFVIGKDGDRDEVCDRFEREVLPTLDVSSLRGKDLICFCKPKRCHCDAILRKANESAR